MAKRDDKPRTEVRSIRLTKDELKQLEATAKQDDRSVAYLLQRIMEAYSGSAAVRSAVKGYFKK